MSSPMTEKTKRRSNEPELPLNAPPPRRSILLLIIAIAGLIVSLLSGFHDEIPGLSSLCASACKDTAEIHLFHLPFWFWGALFYVVLGLSAMIRPKAAPWIAAPAAGIEAVLILLMTDLKAPCVYCIANAVVVLLLIAATFRKSLFWQQATLALACFVGLFFWVPFENDLSHPANGSVSTPSASKNGEPGIAARVGNEVITNQRLDVLLGTRLLDAQKEIYRMKMDKLDQLITEIVIESEAKHQGKSTDAIVEQIAPAGSIKIEESDIDNYIQENQQRIQAVQGAIPDLRDRIKSFLEQQKRSQAIRDYVHSVEAKYDVHIYVPMPNAPKVKVDVRGAPTQGPSDAPVTIIEFSDYQCPACRSVHQTVNEVKSAYGDKVQWIYKDYPLKRHKEAFKAAEASHCAQEQGKFWQYQQELFTTPDLSPDNLINIAVQMGMPRETFSKCLNESKYKGMVEKNAKDAIEAGVDRTPTFIIDGVLYVGGLSLETFKSLIDEDLKKSAAPQPQNAEKTQ